jgi:hypothetical protein
MASCKQQTENVFKHDYDYDYDYDYGEQNITK